MAKHSSDLAIASVQLNGLQSDDNVAIFTFRSLYKDHSPAAFTLLAGYFGYRAGGESPKAAYSHVISDIASLEQRERLIDGLKQQTAAPDREAAL